MPSWGVPESDIAAKNRQLELYVQTLNRLLEAGLKNGGPLDFKSLRRVAEVADFVPPIAPVLEEPPQPPDFPSWATRPLVGLEALLPWRRQAHRAACERAVQRFSAELKAHEERERLREERNRVAQAENQAKVAAARDRHKQDIQAAENIVAAWNAKVDEFACDYEAGKSDAVIAYCSTVLDRSTYPTGFPAGFKLAYVAESRQLVIEYDLPPLSVIPTTDRFTYVKSRGEVQHQRSLSQIRAMYSSVIAQLALRIPFEIYSADQGRHIDILVFNGYVEAIDPATGHLVRPCVVTVRSSRDTFMSLNLQHVDPVACLKSLHVSFSKNPAELVPVRPVLEFDMVDPRFVKESDVLGTLDQRANLMELDPKDFESLVTNLFARMGLETRLTQASRDGGVDCVAYDSRPILGGKVVIQAKRYKHTVGVSAVRDLYGTLQNEGASKGILVTTSGYGKAAFEFAEGKPIELLSGTNLLYLLEKHAGIKAKIVAPPDWRDPVADSPQDK